MLFSGKKMVFKLFGCLKIHFMENQFRCLVRSNIFTENALHSQAIQFFIHFLNCKHVDNESIPHSFIKETKPSKKRKSNPVKLRSRGGGGEIGGEIEATRSSGAVLWSTINAVRSSDWSLVCGRRRSLFFLSLCDLSLSLSRNTLKWKWELNSFSASEALFYGQTENIFSLTQFTGPTKHTIFRKRISEFHLKSKQMDPKSISNHLTRKYHKHIQKMFVTYPIKGWGKKIITKKIKNKK